MNRTGRCKIKPGSINKINKIYGAGRGKRFNYKFIGPDTILIYGRGQEFIISEEELYNNFIV